ncbi:hypothetical protein [Helicobacter mesocricetorum]|nr:hypothetical protein [Helicobacter mesocricetorum]
MQEIKHQIRLCKREEKDKLQSFITKYWNENHILSICDSLLDFQYLDE